jgi:hypothetical protein
MTTTPSPRRAILRLNYDSVRTDRAMPPARAFALRAEPEVSALRASGRWRFSMFLTTANAKRCDRNGRSRRREPGPRQRGRPTVTPILHHTAKHWFAQTEGGW